MSHKLPAAFIDTHCHLDFPAFDPDRDEVIRQSHQQGVDYIINIGVGLQSCRNSLALAQKYDFIYATVGIHPHEADSLTPKDEALLGGLAGKDKVVAIGEIGLDYYKNYSRKESQQSLFATLINLGKELNLPLVIHSRQAEADTLKMLQAAMPIRAVVHCFSGDENFLRGCLELGFFLSFTCNITYPKAEKLRGIVKAAPLEKIFLETDAPYLAPQTLRGRRNDPQNVQAVAAEIARIKGLGIEEVARITTAGAKKFFNLK